MQHDGVSEILASLSENYWIFRGCEAVKEIIRQCNICRHYEGRPYSGPQISDLPTE